MKSVGETMSIGRTFKEALQKSVRSLEQDRFGLGWDRKDKPMTVEQIREKLIVPNTERLYAVRHALKSGMTVDDVHNLSKIDPWFLSQIKEIVDFEDEILRNPAVDTIR